MVVEIDGVVYELPVPSKVPPVAAEYQFSVFVPLAVSVAVPLPQMVAPVAVGAAGIFTVMYDVFDSLSLPAQAVMVNCTV